MVIRRRVVVSRWVQGVGVGAGPGAVARARAAAAAGGRAGAEQRQVQGRERGKTQREEIPRRIRRRRDPRVDLPARGHADRLQARVGAAATATTTAPPHRVRPVGQRTRWCWQGVGRAGAGAGRARTSRIRNQNRWVVAKEGTNRGRGDEGGERQPGAVAGAVAVDVERCRERVQEPPGGSSRKRTVRLPVGKGRVAGAVLGWQGGGDQGNRGEMSMGRGRGWVRMTWWTGWWTRWRKTGMGLTVGARVRPRRRGLQLLKAVPGGEGRAGARARGVDEGEGEGEAPVLGVRQAREPRARGALLLLPLRLSRLRQPVLPTLALPQRTMTKITTKAKMPTLWTR